MFMLSKQNFDVEIKLLKIMILNYYTLKAFEAKVNLLLTNFALSFYLKKSKLDYYLNLLSNNFFLEFSVSIFTSFKVMNFEIRSI